MQLNKTLFILGVVLTGVGMNADLVQQPHSVLPYMSWRDVIREKMGPDSALSTDTALYSQIIRQYNSFSQNESPIIAAPVIKAIPIVECGEPLVDIKEMNNERISMLPNKSVDSLYPGPVASKMRKTVYNKFEQMLTHLDEYSVLFGYKPGQISIKVFEGLRDLKTQEYIFNHQLKQILHDNPHLTYEEAETETSKWVSPIKNNVPAHSTGAAVDFRLWDKDTNSFVDLGIFDEPDKSAPTFSEDATTAQKYNRLFLLIAATRAGLSNYPFEFWHFSFGDRYAAYLQEDQGTEKVAVYGSIS